MEPYRAGRSVHKYLLKLGMSWDDVLVATDTENYALSASILESHPNITLGEFEIFFEELRFERHPVSFDEE